MARRWWLGLGLVLLGCSGGGELVDQTIVRGVVRDAETGDVLAGVVLSTMPTTERVETDAEGAYALQVRLGVRYQVTAARDGYVTQSQPITPSAARGDELDFSLELVRVCAPGSRRCVQGTDESIVQTCGPRGNAWIDAPCAVNQACDPANGECRDVRNLLVILDAPGGLIRSQPVDDQPGVSINCGSQCEADYFVGTTVTLIATPLAQAAFTGWRGACVGTDLSCVVTLTEDLRVGAGFEATAFGVNVETRGRGEGTVTSTPLGIDCPDRCSAAFDRDATVVFEATPAQGSLLARWEGDCSQAGSATRCTLTVEEPKSIGVVFVEEGIELQVQTIGTGAGGVSSSPEGIDCGANCITTFADGADVTLTASAASGSNFIEWGGDCAGTTPTCVVTMDVPRQVTARFDGRTQPVTVEQGGGGFGRVTSVPSGMDCPTTCQVDFAEGGTVELVATADPGSGFAGWQLDCAGTNPSCVLTADAPRRARANFEPGYLFPLAEDAQCVFALHLDAADPTAVGCGAGPSAQILGTYGSVPSRVGALGEAQLAQGADEEGAIDAGRMMPAAVRGTIEMTMRMDGPAFGARGRAALLSDLDTSEPQGAGIHLMILDDGRLMLGTRDGLGGTSTATTAGAVINTGTWYHVAATVDPAAGLAVFVDGAPVLQDPGPLRWVASSSTAWVGAEREGAGGNVIHRFNGAVDEVRVSDVVRY